MIYAVILSVFSFQSVSIAKPSFKKVMIVVFENTDYAAAMKQPFFAEFAKVGANLENMSALTHPSQGNYISMISGETYKIINDNKVDLKASHIGDLIDAKKLSWKVYAEDYPGNCFKGETAGNYARKHIPFMSFTSVSTNPARCKNIVDASQLDGDINSESLPNYSMYIPNLKNDGHNTGVAFADKWFNKKFGPLMKDAKFMNEMLLIVTFDEAESHKSNQIYTALYGDSVIAGATSKKPYTHYSILKTIEAAWDLGSLHKQDEKAEAITDILK